MENTSMHGLSNAQLIDTNISTDLYNPIYLPMLVRSVVVTFIYA